MTNAYIGIDTPRTSVHSIAADDSRGLKRKVKSPRLLLFLLFLGIVAGPLNYGLKEAIEGLLALRRTIAEEYSGIVGFSIWASYSIALVLIACGITALSPIAEGSGLPQMKTVLTGVDPGLYLPGFFRIRTFVAKLGGLVFAVGSGLVV